MANVKMIEITVNKEIARQAYDAGFGYAMADTGNVLTVEGFEDWWSELQLALANASTSANLYSPNVKRLQG